MSENKGKAIIDIEDMNYLEYTARKLNLDKEKVYSMCIKIGIKQMKGMFD